MKRNFVWVVLGFNLCLANAQVENDPVVMTVAGKDIPVSEFLFLAQKDTSVNLLEKKSLESYVELFKNFKLKVAEAESKRFNESQNFNDELNSYKSQLRDSYLSDREGEAKAVRKVYDRERNILSASHILFKFPSSKVVSKDTTEAFRAANEAYRRIVGGEDFTTIGETLAADSTADVIYETIDYIFPLQALKPFEDAVYALKNVGDVSRPVRTNLGFHLIRLDRRIENPGKLKVAHILISPVEDPFDPKENEDEVLLAKATAFYDRAVNGENFGELARHNSADMGSVGKGGELPYFGLGEMVRPFEEAAFAMKDTGEISRPVKTRYGYHVIKLLEKAKHPSYEEEERSIYVVMKQGEWNFELFKSFEDREKEKFGYVFYPEAYADLQRLCDDYHPEDTTFYNRARLLTEPLFTVNGDTIPQSEFAEYLHLYPFSTKSYAGDFLYDVYRQFVRTIVSELEKRTLSEYHPEYDRLVKEYYDGILLFEISSDRVWDKPVEEQEQLEAEWLKELSQKFEVKINRKVLKDLKKHIKKEQS
ncbi:MAG: peptidylprolyl isomerase [Tannerella sp.]|jgi:peptidyl-prolyl cis-trans isomerase SurA|nr:peptidylprolyl isomerase [Tannerella sp.]